MKKILIAIICIIVFGTIIYSAISLGDSLVMVLFLIFFMMIIVGIFIGIVSLPIILAMKFAKKDIKKDKLSKEDILKNELMYRDILYTYSPAILSYIDEMEFNYQTVVISTLLNMELKGVIEKSEKGIIKKVEKINEIQLDGVEKIIFDGIQNGKIVVEPRKLENVIIREALNQNVIYANDDFNNLLKNKAKKVGIIYLMLFVIFILLVSFNNPIMYLFLAILPTYPMMAIIYLIYYVYKYRQNPIFRTKKGDEINKKLEGLKNFIKEYSLLDSKNEKQLEIWEEYLIYSVIFEQNTIIIKEYAQYL